MMQALRIAATGMHAQQLNVDVLSNNIANLNTVGYKQQNAAFEDLVYLNKVGVGSITSNTGTLSPTGLQIGLGVNTGSVYKIMSQGSLQSTGNSFDLAVSGRGFLKISLPDGTTAYTRDGSLQINQNGTMVSKDGFELDPGITIPADATDVTVSDEGVVSANVAGTVTQLGTITLAMFTNEAGLQNVGNNYYLETEASGTATDANPGESGSGTIRQGFLEQSNVDAIESITRLITAQRSYELNSRVIATADEMLQTLNQVA